MIMVSANSLSSTASASTNLLRDRLPRLSSSLPPTPMARFPSKAPRFSASYASAGQREKDGGRHRYDSRSCRGGAEPSGLPLAAGTLYDVLGLSAGATAQEIKAAFRRLARECHPDVAAARPSAEEFMRIHAAYATLSDPNKRAEYDRRTLTPRNPLFRSTSAASYRYYRSPASSNPSSPLGFPRRTWETDQCW